MSTDYKNQIVEIAREMDGLPFPPVTKEDYDKWWEQLEILNATLCCFDNE